MKSRHNLIIAAGILILAISGNAIWLSEIIYRFTWASLGWLYSTLYSPYLLVAFPAIAFLLPFILRRRIGIKKIFIPLILLYFINLTFYRFGDHFLRMHFGRWSFFWIFNREGYLFFVYLLGCSLILFSLFGLCYTIAVKYFLVEIRPRSFILFALVLIPVLPLSCLTYKTLPVTEDTEWFYNAIKAGYPVFWTIIVMGSAGWTIEKRTRETLESNTP